MKISIITPNYNYEKYIAKTIESVVTQSFNNIEHIIVDDGSTDNSVSIIKEYQNLYPEIIKLIQQENRGQTSALNVCLKNVTGDIIGWLNSDDLYCKNTFQIIINNFNQNKNIDAIIGNINIIDSEGRFLKKNRYLKFDYNSGVFNGFGKVVASNAIFWRKNLSDEIDMFDESFQFAMDSEYWSRLLYNRTVKYINFEMANFRWHPKAKTILRRKYNSQENLQANKENKIIFSNSYKLISLSKFFPGYLYILPFLYYKSKRHILKLINFHYFDKR